jgi:uncharacterized protein HemX
MSDADARETQREEREIHRDEAVIASVAVIDKTDRLVKGLALVVVVMIVLIAGLTYQVQKRNQQIEQISDSAEHINERVDELNRFVDQLQAPNEEEEAQQQAISRAVRLVPEIKSILCEEFPEASACLSG